MKIYRTCNPSKFVKKEEMHEMLKVRMTCGGGVGGSSWYEYIHSDYDSEPIDLQSESPIYVTNYLGEEIMLNPKFIVKVSHISIVKVVEDITAWRTYASGPDGKQYLRTAFIETKPYETAMLVDEYKFDGNKDETINAVTTAKRIY